jgi:hypothetical protein
VPKDFALWLNFNNKEAMRQREGEWRSLRMSVDLVSVGDVASGKGRGDDAGYVGGYNSKAAISLVMNRGEIQVRQQLQQSVQSSKKEGERGSKAEG